ncbi:MAG: MFS transporter [Steroidobacteraceae bacterium]|jgi:MFS family permease|nr:MFS transporter [Steroidobacteraceae bacterium]
MSTPHTGQKLGPVRLMPGVTRGHTLSYLWAAFVSIGIFTYATSLLPYLLEVNIGVPPEQRGAVSGNLQFWQEVVSLVMVGFFGAWSDRVGRRTVYVIGFLVAGLAYAAYPYADDLDQLLIYRLVFAVGIAALGGMLATVLADYPVDADRGKLTGISFFLNAVGALLFFAVLSRLPQFYQNAGFDEVGSGRAAYLTIAGVCVLSALIMFGLKPGRPDQVTKREPLMTLLRQGLAAGRNPRIALAYGASFAARADLVIVALFLSLWVQTAAIADGYNAADAAAKQGALFGIVQGCAMLWAPFFGWLADKINRVTLVILATVLSIAGYGWMGFTPDPAASAAAFGAAAMLGIGQASGILASQVLIGQEAPGPIRGAVIGMVGFFGALGILAISKVGGWAFDAWRPGAPFIIMAGANVLLLLFAFYVRFASAPRPAEQPVATA